MVKNLTCLFILVFLLLDRKKGYTQSNNHGDIYGQILDNNHKPLGYATVTLLKGRDSSLVKGAIADAAGIYRFQGIPIGRYLVSASVLGFQKAYSLEFVLNAQIKSKDLGGMSLIVNSKTLRGLKVTAAKPFIVHKVDKTVVNVENSVVDAGSNALEILQKSPGVTVDYNDNITLNGKSGVAIYIDGKPTYLSQTQIVALLRNMSSSSIHSIELMTQPSAKYDAAGNAGIINIVTRKNKLWGFNGSITGTYSQGIYNQENGGINLNYRSGKFNVYGNYNYGYDLSWQNLKITRNFYDGAAKSLSTKFVQNSIMKFPSNNHNFKTGVDFNLNDHNTIGFMINGTINPGSSDTRTTTTIDDASGNLQSNSLTHNTSQEFWSNYTYDLNYHGVLDSSGRELDMDMAFSKFYNSSKQNFRTDQFNPDGSPSVSSPGSPNPNIRLGNLPSLIDIKTAKVDYTNPLKNKAKLEFGFKTSFVTSDNNVQYFNYLAGAFVNDTNATNHFKYKENINAAYINFKKQFARGWSIQAGLRGEQTLSTGHQYTNDSTVKRNYFQLFPTAYLSKQLNKDHTLSLSYARRIDRPDYQDLNPFRYYLDPYTYQVGNPFLQPQLTQSLEFSYSYKGALTATLNYSHTRDNMTQVLNQVDSSRITYQTRDNLSTFNNLGMSFSVNIPVTKWWMTNNFINVFYNQYKGVYLGANLNLGQTSFQFNTMNSFILPKAYTLELEGFYRSPFVYGIIQGRSMYSVSAGIQKTIWKGKGTIKMNINDIFDTQRFDGTVRYQNLDVGVRNYRDSRRIGLTFTYNFSKGKMKPEQQHRSSIEEEQNRIKTGNN